MSTPRDVYKHAKAKAWRMVKMQGPLEDYLILTVAKTLSFGVGVGVGYWIWG